MRRWIGFFLGALVVQCVLFWFVTSEQTYYFWDSLTHFDQYRSLFLTPPAHTLWSAFQLFWESVTYEDHSVLVITPLLFLRTFLGTSRLAFVEALFLSYVVPATTIVFIVLRRYDKKQKQVLNVWSWFLLGMTMWVSPMFLHTAVMGMPDNIVSLTIALLLVISFPLLEDVRTFTWKRAIAFGVVCALGEAFRSVTIYFFMGFAIGVVLLLIMQKYKHSISWVTFFSVLEKYIVAGILCFALLRGIGGVIWSRIFVSYHELYKGYMLFPFIETVFRPWLFGNGIFWCVLFLAISIVNLIFPGKRFHGWFFLCLTYIPYVVICFIVTPVPNNFVLVFPGMALLTYRALSIMQSKWSWWWQRTITGVVTVVMILIFMVSYTSNYWYGAWYWMFPFRRTFPEIRRDIPDIQALLHTWFREWEKDKETHVYVLGCSGRINDDVFRDACVTNSYPSVFCSSFSIVACVDGRDRFPRRFFEAQYVVTSEKDWYHLHSNNQRVIGVLATEFLSPSGRLLPYYDALQSFLFGIDTRVYLYKKIMPIPKSLQDTLEHEYNASGYHWKY